MANTGRYFSCPAVRKIRGNRRTLLEWVSMKLRKRNAPDLFMICDYYPACYPANKK